MRRATGTFEGLKEVVKKKKFKGYNEREAVDFAISLIEDFVSVCKIKVLRSKLYEEYCSIDGIDRVGTLQAKQSRRDHLVEDL